jgi:hypothetical protein
MPKPKRVRQGYFVRIRPNWEFKNDDGIEPKGIYLHHGVAKAYIDYAGIEGRHNVGLQIPGKVKFLRELASAFEQIADDIYLKRHPKRKK